jgi:hypothetical protein
MKDSFKLFPLFTALILMVFAPFILQAQGKPVLTGKISLKVSRVIPMKGATVELRKAATGKGLFKTYTDSRGNFAFYRIPKGTYYLTVLRGRKVFYQLNKGKKQKVTIGGPGSSRRLNVTVKK